MFPYFGLNIFVEEMKSIFIIGLVFLLISCNSSDQSADEISVDLNGSMTAIVNGVDWVSGPNNSASINYNEGKVHIEGFEAEDGIIRSHITLIVDEINAGTYDAQSSRAIYYDVRTKNSFVSEDTCNVDITELDQVNNSVSGAFNFSGKNLETGEIREFLSGEFTKVNLTITE